MSRLKTSSRQSCTLTECFRLWTWAPCKKCWKASSAVTHRLSSPRFLSQGLPARHRQSLNSAAPVRKPNRQRKLGWGDLWTPSSFGRKRNGDGLRSSTQTWKTPIWVKYLVSEKPKSARFCLKLSVIFLTHDAQLKQLNTTNVYNMSNSSIIPSCQIHSSRASSRQNFPVFPVLTKLGSRPC